MSPTLLKSLIYESQKDNFYALSSSRESPNLLEMGRNNCGQMLMHRQCGDAEVMVFWDRKSGFIRGRVCREGKAVLADLCGLPGRKVEEGQLCAVRRYFEGVAVRVQGRRVEVWLRLLGGGKNVDLKEEALENILKGATEQTNLDDRERYLIELTRRFQLYEEWVRAGDSNQLCVARNNFLILSQSEVLNVVIRAMNDLIYALENDPCEASTSDNLVKIYWELWDRIEKFEGGSTIKLEKLTRAFGWALNALIEHYNNGHITKFPQKVKKGEETIDLKKKIWGQIKILRECVQGKNKNINIRYNLTFIKEVVKRLNTTESRGAHLGKAMAKAGGEAGKSVLNLFTVGLTGPAISGGGLWDLPKTLFKIGKELATDQHFRRKQGWSKQEGSGKLTDIDLETYRKIVPKNAQKDPKKKWHWHYRTISFIGNVIMYSRDDVLVAAVKEDLSLYLAEKKLKQTDTIEIRLYQVLYELVKNDPNIKPQYQTFLQGRVKWSDKAKESIQLIEQDIECRDFWHKKKAKKEIGTPASESKTVSVNSEKLVLPEKSPMNALGKSSFLDINVTGDGACLFRAIALGCVYNHIDIENLVTSGTVNANESVSKAETDNTESCDFFRTPPLMLSKQNFGEEIISEQILSLLPQFTQKLREETLLLLPNKREEIKNQIAVFFHEAREFFRDQPDNRDFDGLFRGVTGNFRNELINARKKGPEAEQTYANSDEGIRNYIEHMGNSKAWGGGIELGILAAILKAKILVYNDQTPNKPFHDVGEGDVTIYLFFTGDHYKLRIPTVPFLEDLVDEKGESDVSVNLFKELGSTAGSSTVNFKTKPEICKYEEPVHFFCGRTDVLQEIEDVFSSVKGDPRKTKVVVLEGSSGIGKTQLARKFISENCTNYSMVYTFNGQSEATLNEDYRNLAYRLKVFESPIKRFLPLNNICCDINNKLERITHKRWFWLFDSIEKFETLKPLMENFPDIGGHILITLNSGGSKKVTTLRAAKVKVTCSIHISELDKSLSDKLLAKITEQENDVHLKKLSEKLKGLPLALNQAGCWMNMKNKSPVDYLHAYKEIFKKAKSQFQVKFNNSYFMNKLITTTTFSMNRECIKADCWMADEVLDLFAYFNRAEIPIDFIQDWVRNQSICESEKVQKMVDEIVEILSDKYAAAIYDDERKCISICRLIQKEIQMNLERNKSNHAKFIKKALDLLKKQFDFEDPENTNTCKFIDQSSLIHAENVVNHVFNYYCVENVATEVSDDIKTILKTSASLFYAMGLHVFSRGDIFQAEKYYESALKMKERLHDEDSEKVELQNYLRWISYFLERSRKPEPHCFYTLEINADQKMKLQVKRKSQVSFGDAKECITEMGNSPEKFKRDVRLHYWFLAKTWNKLGVDYCNLGMEKEAVEYFKRALYCNDVYRDNRYCLTEGIVQMNLAEAWRKLEDLDSACNCAKEAQRFFYKLFGNNHPRMIQILNILGAIHYDKGELKKSCEYYQDALSLINEYSFPLDVARTQMGLGNALREEETLKSLHALKKAHKAFVEIYGSTKHPELAKCKNCLGKTYHALAKNLNNGAYENVIQASNYYSKAYKMAKAYFGEDHSVTKRYENDLKNLKESSKKDLSCEQKRQNIRSISSLKSLN